MTTDALDGARPGLIARVRNMLIRPQSEWARIANEEPAPLIGAYVAPLAWLGAAASVAAHVLYEGPNPDAALAWKAIAAVLYVVFAIAGVIVAAIVINSLAGRFGAERNSGRARQLAAYAATPILVAALGALAPPVAALLLVLGLSYSLILLGLGVGRLLPMPDPENSTPRFVLAFAGVAAVLAVLATLFISPLAGAGREAVMSAIQPATEPAPSAAEPARRSAAERAIDRLARDDGARMLADPARLEEQFPDSMPGGFRRQSVATAQGGGVSRADAVYAQEGTTLNVAIVQFARDVDPAGAAVLFQIREDASSGGGYARTQRIDGRLFAEEADAEGNVRYIVIGRGVAMMAEGRVTVDQARAAIETIGLRRLEAAFGR